MHSTDALIVLVRAFPLDGVLADTQGFLAHMFTGDFEFTAAELDAGTIRLSAQMDGLSVGAPGLARRLLEANLSGVETGAGAMAPDPVGSGLYALVDTVAIGDMEVEDFRLRVVDFMLYVEYWRAEGIDKLRAALAREAKSDAGMADAVVMRG